jgi:hypothetical protein
MIETAGAAENETTMADQPRSVLDGLNLDTAIRLRWALRDIKAGRIKFTPLSENDRMALIELGLIEMRDDQLVLTLPMRVIAHSIGTDPPPLGPRIKSQFVQDGCGNADACKRDARNMRLLEGWAVAPHAAG